MKKFTAALALVCALAAAATAAAATVGSGRSAATSGDASGIAYGVADDTGKFADDGGAWFNSMLKGANLTEERWTVSWNPGSPTASNDTWSVPPVPRMETVVIPRFRNGSIHFANTGTTASLPWV